MTSETSKPRRVPFFGARGYAKKLIAELEEQEAQTERLKTHMRELGVLTALEMQERRSSLESELAGLEANRRQVEVKAEESLKVAQDQLEQIRGEVIATEDLILLQEAGVYEYRHPLSDAVAYQKALASLAEDIKQMVRKDGGAVLSASEWTVNGSAAQGRAMVREISKLMLRAFNAEADNLVRGLKPYKLVGAAERLKKVATTIERLGKTMNIRIANSYLQLRLRELELTADYLQKQAEEKEAERAERERLREERKAQQELERERLRLEKERQHFLNVLNALEAKGDSMGAARIQEQLEDVQRALVDVDYRQANIRAGYVYVISNVGSFGESMVKIGMTRRLDPMDRIRELSDASVPFNFDVHAVFFSKDAVGIETELHSRLAVTRVNQVNLRREFFHVAPGDVKELLAALAGELLEFYDVPEATEYRQSLQHRQSIVSGNN